jgi:nicotinamidase-related amidase
MHGIEFDAAIGLNGATARRSFLKRCGIGAAAWSGLSFEPLKVIGADAGANDKRENADGKPAFGPKVAGQLALRTRRRRERLAGSGTFDVVEGEAKWNASETAIIICDMWEDHPCLMAAHRVEVMAPKMNRVVSAARSLGVSVIHAPSSGMAYYADTAFRKRMQLLPKAEPPVEIEGWCYLDPEREADYPVPYSGKVEEVCDDPTFVMRENVSRRQHPAIKIVGFDGVSDSGHEIYNFMAYQGIRNVVLMGVHTHLCVLGRPFGIRQMVKLGKNVVLARDLTDTMYDPRTPPYVSHERGTELTVEHVEKYWCPTIDSADLTRVVAGTAGP